VNLRLASGLAASMGVLIWAVVAGDQAVSRQARKDRVTVTYWEKWTGAEADEMRKVVNAFNASQSRIFVQYLSISGVDSKTMLAAAGGNPPDVAGIWLDQLVQFADARALTDLTPLAREHGVTASQYIPSFYNGLVYKGKLWALPSTPATIALYVRKDLVPPQFASAATFPQTVEAFDDLSQQISKKNPDGSLKLAGFLPSYPGWYNWSWGPLFGGKILDGDRLTLTSPENLRAFKWIDKYTKFFGSQQMASFQSGFGNFASPEDPFMEGKVAAEINGVWKAGYVNTYHAGIPWFAVPFPYPADRPDLKGHSYINEDILTIPRGAQHPREAFEFIQFVQRQDVMEQLCRGQGKNTPLAKVSERFFEGNQNHDIRLFDSLARSPNVIPTPQIGIWSQVRSEIDNAFQEVNTGQKTPEVALKDAQDRLESTWRTYKEQVLGDRG
jgi:ABC-type glycerol-3-phosphate transport system substrate-binding protein